MRLLTRTASLERLSVRPVSSAEIDSIIDLRLQVPRGSSQFVSVNARIPEYGVRVLDLTTSSSFDR